MQPRPVAARAVVTRRAIVDIVRSAVQSSYGVTGFRDPSLLGRLAAWLRPNRRGIRLAVDGGLNLDLYLTVAYGVPVAEVARQVDSAVRYALRRALGREVACLSVHVSGLRYQPTPAHAASARSPEAGPPEGEAAAAGPTAVSAVAASANGTGADGRPATGEGRPGREAV